jgi:asparagine synthase (glutamine-hydrolysing)
MTVTGADAATVREAIERGDPLPDTTGFAGELDGTLVRDVLGRYPLFFETARPEAWSHDPTDLTEPQRLPAGHLREESGQRQHWTLPAFEPRADTDDAVTAVRDALDVAIANVETDGLAVAFSGGIDSALLAARLDVPLYVAGFPESHDLAAARSGAELLDRDLRVVELDHGTLERAVPELARATGRTNAMDIQIALGLYLVAERVARDGFDRLALGQGADELFGGYAKVARAPGDPRVEANTVRGARREVVEGLPDQLERDQLALRAAGVRPVTPLLHDQVVHAALSLPGSALVADDTRKWALRQATREWLPDELRTREKKALQYGSLVARELDRLARQAGYKRRMDSHVQQYVESRL